MAAYSIIKCYDTEENAVDGGITGLIAGSTTVDTWPFGFIVNDASTGSSAPVYNGIYNKADHVPFFIFNEYWFRIESNEGVMAFHIDWDDGEDNSGGKSNYQIITNHEPRFWAVTSHVYSKLGRFWPLIRAESVDGFVSKWYTSDQTARLDGEDYKALLNIKYRTGASTVPHGANNSFIIREEKTTTSSGSVSARIPHMRPANLPPVAVLKGDRRRIFAGIDNDQIEFRSGQKPLLYAYSELASLPAVTVTMEVEDEDTGQIQEYAAVPLHNDASLSSWGETQTRDDAVPSGGQYGSGSFEVQKIKFDEADAVGEATTTNSYNNKYLRIGAGSAGASATTHIATFYHPIVAQVYTLTIATPADGTGSAMEMSAANSTGAGPYIDVYSSVGGTHRWWFDCSGSQTAPSTPAPGYLEKIDVSDAEHDPDLGNVALAAEIAAEIQNGIATGIGGGVSEQFTATALQNVITITNTTSVGTAWTATGFANPPGPDPVTWTKVTEGESAGVAQSLSAHTALSVEFASGDSAATLAGLAATAINNNSNYTCTAEGDVITVTQVVSGPITVQVVDSVNNSNVNNDAPLSITGAGTEGQIDGTSSTGSLNSARRLYKAKLSDIDTLGDDDRIYIKVHNFDIAEGGLAKPVSADNTVAILSNGNPIIDLTDPLLKTMLDGSESLTRAGNLNIKNYYFDLDKGLLGTNVQAYTSQSINTGVGELTGLMSTYFNNFNDPTKETMYTHHNTGFPYDSNGRFKDFSRLCRLQVEDDSVEFIVDKLTTPGALGRDDGDRITRSMLEFTDGATPMAITRLRLKGRGSFTKGAKITQTTTGATGYVLETTVNQNWLRLYNTSKVSNYNSSGTAFLDNASAPYALASDNSTDTGNLWILAGGIALGTYRIPYNFFENNTHEYIFQSSNRSGISTHANNFPSITTNLASAMTATTSTVNCDSTAAFKINDTIKIDDEFMKVISITNATNMEVKREYLGSGDIGHDDDSAVYRGTSNLLSVIGYNDDGTNPVLGGSASNQLWAESTWGSSLTKMPENFIYIGKSEKFSNIYMRMKHGFKPPLRWVQQMVQHKLN